MSARMCVSRAIRSTVRAFSAAEVAAIAEKADEPTALLVRTAGKHGAQVR
jgi:hypothetical protein